MSTATSSRFISVAATGENWRDISQKVLSELASLTTDGFKPNIGLLYMTEQLAADAASIVTLFRSVSGIEHWHGCSAMGVCANGIEYVGVPAISMLVGHMPPDHFRTFFARESSLKHLHKELEPWLNRHDPMLVLTHVAGQMDSHPAHVLEDIDAMIGGFMVGGVESSRGQNALIAGDVHSEGVGGLVFSQDVPVAVSLSQGCVPMGPQHDVSKADDHVIGFLDGRVPFEVFSEDMSAMAEKRLGYKPKEVLLGQGTLAKDLAELLDGQAHIAIPVPGSDIRNYMVRNIMAIDPENGMMAVAEILEEGQKILFVHRNDDSVISDLSSSLVSLRKRVEHEHGGFHPKAAIYISCVARADVSFARDGEPGGEMALVQEILGDLPLAGFYASGEISNNRLYGYTSIVALLL